MSTTIKVKDEGRTFAIDRGRGTEYVRFKAWREARPKVFGYGMTETEAVEDLRHHVQPLEDDGEIKIERA